MPQTYTITDPTTGRQVKLTGDSPPTEAELTEIFMRINAPAAPAATQPSEPDARRGRGVALPDAEGFRNAIDFGKGVLKAPLAVLEAGGNLIRKIPGVQAAEDALGAYVDTGIDTKPQNTAQSVGRVAGDIALAFAPAGAVTKGAKLAAGAVPKMAAPLARGAVEAAGAGGIAAAQGYDPTAAAVTGGALGTVAGAAAPIINKLKKSADTSMIAALGPAGRGTGPAGSNDLALAKKLAPQLIERGFKATSHEAALSKIGDILEVANAKIDDKMMALPAGSKVPTYDLIKFFQDVKNQAKVNGVATGTGKIINDVLDVYMDDLRQMGPSLTPEQVVKLKRQIAPLAKFSKLASESDNTKAEANQIIYNGLRESMNQLDSGLGPVNKEVGFWLKVHDVIEKTSRRPQPPSSGTGGAVLGAIIGGQTGPWGAAGMAVAGRQMQRLMRSPGWRFISANMKDDLANAMAKHDLGRFNQLVAAASSQLGDTE